VEPIIHISKLSKRYNNHLAVNKLSLDVQRGEIFGFIGPNGAGKTSTIRILATLLAPTSGDAQIGGYSVTGFKREVRRQIGYMPDFFGTYSDLTVFEYLDFFAGCYEIAETRKVEIIPDLLELVDLHQRSNDQVDKLSRGAKQRLSLARTLIHDPQVLILDEPASGLDPRARVEIRELLRELAHMGKTIFFSSHILSDVAEICSRIAIIEAGELVVSGTPAELSSHRIANRRVLLGTLSSVERVRTLLSEFQDVVDITFRQQDQAPYELEIEFAGDLDSLAAFLTQLIEQEIQIVHFSEITDSLEDIYLRTTRGLVT
jgi:ABC-2 type transport system ATP-binding protein